MKLAIVAPARLAEAAVARLSKIGRLDAQEVEALRAAADQPRGYRARGELVIEGQPIRRREILLSGWAARTRVFPDGRRQLLSFVLPGDLIGHCEQEGPIATSTIIAITDVASCVAPDEGGYPGLVRAYAMSRALDEAHLLSQIARLGRMTAYECILDLMLELYERHMLAGLVSNGEFECPLTQDVLADATALTSVHLNRMVQVLRRNGLVRWQQGQLKVLDHTAACQALGRPPVRVTI